MAYYMQVSFPGSWDKPAREYTWHINNTKPPLPPEAYIMLFQADGDELDLIISRLKNVPYCYSVAKWRGQMAQFIYDNITKS